MSQDIDQLFQKTKGHLFFKKGSGFIGALLCKLNFKWVTELEGQPMSTACISADTLYWNPDFFLSLDEKSRVTVLAHELWHNAYLHGSRINERDPMLWNVAGDHVINLMLEEHGYYMDGFPYLRDPKYRKMSTDEVYDDLMKQCQNGEPKPSNDLGQDILPMTEQDKAKNLTNVVSAATVARMSGQPGTVPGEVETVLDEFLHPKLPWQTILFNFFNALTNQEYSFARPNRRYEDPILPGRTGRSGLEHLMYFLDVSGSVSEEDIVRFNSEVKFIQEELQPEKLSLVTFDTRIQDEYVFEKDDPFERVVVHGRGGTSLECVYEHIKKHQPTAAVIFSDLYVRVPKEDPGLPLVWICINHPEMTMPYGTLIHLED